MTIKKKKFLFIVQGEGRGHMTQSISLQTMIQNAGMEVCEVLVGKSPNRVIPEFYYRRINAPITGINSPNFVTDAKHRKVRMLPSVFSNLFKLNLFRESLAIIDKKIKEHNPDVIVNFYDPLMGLYYLFNRPSIPMICIAHQYLFLHPDFEFPQGNFMDKQSLKLYTQLTALGSNRKLALSFYPFENNEKHGVYVIPPLLREEVFRQSVRTDDYLLVYLVNNGYSEDIIAWSKKNPTVKIHCFMDKPGLLDEEQINENLFFHKINDQKFLSMMSHAKGLISTAGFESVCEAMYLKKPVLMIPVEGHYEQYCNSRDAFKAGAGLYDKKFDIGRLLNYLSTYRDNSEHFRGWVHQSSNKTIEQLRMEL